MYNHVKIKILQFKSFFYNYLFSNSSFNKTSIHVKHIVFHYKTYSNSPFCKMSIEGCPINFKVQDVLLITVYFDIW